MSSGYGQICPVAAACEVFGERWTPLILREMFAGSQRFNEIHRGLPLISRTLLAQRLRTLEAAGVVVRQPGAGGYCYRLTDAGLEFRGALDALAAWGQRWTVRFDRDNLDPSFLMWNVRRGIVLDRVPAARTVVRFKFTGVPSHCRGPRLFWLVLEARQADLCIKDVGFQVDLYVDADLASMAKFWLGDLEIRDAVAGGKLALAGPRELVRAFPGWLKRSRFAAVPRPRAQSVPA